jgi:hypothetical protein
VRIEVSIGVRFASDEDGTNGSVLLKQADAASKKYARLAKEEGEGVSKTEDDEEKAEGEGEKRMGRKVGARRKRRRSRRKMWRSMTMRRKEKKSSSPNPMMEVRICKTKMRVAIRSERRAPLPRLASFRPRITIKRKNHQ